MLFQKYYGLLGTGSEHIVELEPWVVIASLFATGLAVGVSLSVGSLFVLQVHVASVYKGLHAVTSCSSAYFFDT